MITTSKGRPILLKADEPLKLRVENTCAFFLNFKTKFSIFAFKTLEIIRILENDEHTMAASSRIEARILSRSEPALLAPDAASFLCTWRVYNV